MKGYRFTGLCESRHWTNALPSKLFLAKMETRSPHMDLFRALSFEAESENKAIIEIPSKRELER